MKAPLCLSSALAALAGLGLLHSCGPGETDAAETTEPENPPPALTARSWHPEEPELAAGREVYLVECALCHDEGEENAPRLGRADAWAPRLEKGESVLIDHAINGFNGEEGEMPARGGTETLTDAEVMAAVRFMIAFPRED